MAGYTYATLAQAQASLASRLYQSATDTAQQFWTASEITVYVVEALRTWNALTSFWRAEFPFTLVQNQFWYSIPGQANSIRPFTITDQSLVTTCEYHLLEPLTSSYPLTWTGSLQFSVADILEALTRNQNQALGSSGCTITQANVAAPVSDQRIFLSDSSIDIRRVAWIPATGFGFVNTPLRQTDVWAKRAFDYGYTTAPQEPPDGWMQNAEPPLSFDVDRVVPVEGTYDVLTVNAGATFDADAAQLLSVPDDWSWVVKWGALADLLSRESNAKDPLRAAYCAQRFEEGCRLMSDAAALLSLQINGIPLFVDAVTNGDNFNPLWQANAAASPSSCYTAGLNLIAFPAPDAGPYSALATVVKNAPVPSANSDYIQVARNDYDAIINYAQHLAMVKVGGAEFLATVPLYQAFMRQASQYNKKLVSQGQFQMPMYEVSQLEEERNPRGLSAA